MRGKGMFAFAAQLLAEFEHYHIGFRYAPPRKYDPLRYPFRHSCRLLVNRWNRTNKWMNGCMACVEDFKVIQLQQAAGR